MLHVIVRFGAKHNYVHKANAGMAASCEIELTKALHAQLLCRGKVKEEQNSIAHGRLGCYVPATSPILRILKSLEVAEALSEVKLGAKCRSKSERYAKFTPCN